MDVMVEWFSISGQKDDRWNDNCGLYAYLAPTQQRAINYLGKVDGCTVRTRHRASDKHKVYRRLEEDFGHYEHEIIVADVKPPKGCRLTRKLLADIESLLIYLIQPVGNTSNKKSRRYYRPGMRVICRGAVWPLARRTFVDIGQGAIR
jgi:hypothetical protein